MRTAGTPVTAMTILGSGNVGIGTTSPSVPLQVNGNILLSGNSVNNVGDQFFIQNSNATNASGGTAGLYVSQMGTTGYSIDQWANASIIESQGAGGLVLDAFGGSGNNMTFQVNRGAAMTILGANGNVGIGTTGPGYALDVQGASSDLRIRVKNTGSGDALFMADASASNGYSETQYAISGTQYGALEYVLMTAIIIYIVNLVQVM